LTYPIQAIDEIGGADRVSYGQLMKDRAVPRIDLTGIVLDRRLPLAA